MLLFRYLCGHIGRMNSAPRAKAEAFIRVAEIRSSPVVDVDKKCPACHLSFD